MCKSTSQFSYIISRNVFRFGMHLACNSCTISQTYRNYLPLSMNGSSLSVEVKSIRGINTRVLLCTLCGISAPKSQFKNVLTIRRVSLHKLSSGSRFLKEVIDVNPFWTIDINAFHLSNGIYDYFLWQIQ